MSHQTPQVNPQIVELRSMAQLALAEPDPHLKLERVSALSPEWPIDPNLSLTITLGRPARPVLVEPRKVPHRSVSSAEGRGMLLHALAHIEFNAINLALDLIVRFAGMPNSFYLDWLKVAQEEAFHHHLLAQRLIAYGLTYGHYAAHDGLWQMAEKTSESLLARLALVPRLLEARGLDVSPAIRKKLDEAGDAESAAVLDVILRDEIGHVAIGNRWFNAICDAEALEPVQAFEACLARYAAPKPRSPFNFKAREQAGFSADELAWLYQLELEQSA